MSFLDRIFGKRPQQQPSATAAPIEQESRPAPVERKSPANGTSQPKFTTEGLLTTLAQIHERRQNLSLADVAEVLVWAERKTNYSTVLHIMLGAAAENQRVYCGDLKSAYMKCWWQWYEHQDDPHLRAEKLLVIAAYPEHFRPESKLEWYLIGHLVVWLRAGAPDRSADLTKHFGSIPSRDEIAANQTAEMAQKLPTLARPSASYLNDDYKPRARTSMQDAPKKDTQTEKAIEAFGVVISPMNGERAEAIEWFDAIASAGSTAPFAFDLVVAEGPKLYMTVLICFFDSSKGTPKPDGSIHDQFLPWLKTAAGERTWYTQETYGPNIFPPGTNLTVEGYWGGIQILRRQRIGQRP